MEQYISKATVVAEIERIMNEQQEICKADVIMGKEPNSKSVEVIYQFQQLIKFIGTLEVKEVNFLELKEVEDERIRNFISNELTCLRATDGKGSDRYEELTNAIVWLEKQGEHNFAKWSEEDEHRVKDTIYFLETAKKHYASTVELDACIDWLKSLKQRIGD